MPGVFALSGLPAELRIKIYAELLVWREPIVFTVAHETTPWSLLRSRDSRLYPAILLVSRQTLLEARPLLYCNNRFDVPISIGRSTFFEKEVLPLAPFLTQIGAQASLIRHIRIIFPCFSPHRYRPGDKVELGRLHVDYLNLLQSACPGIKTLEFSLLDTSWIANAYCALDAETEASEVAEVADPLALLDARLKAFPSLRNIIVSAQVYDDDAINGDDDGDDDMWRRKMHNYGWTVNVQTVKCPQPPVVSDEVWELDSEEDYHLYAASMSILMEEELQANAWSRTYWGHHIPVSEHHYGYDY